jgi:hypothetical protein
VFRAGGGAVIGWAYAIALLFFPSSAFVLIRRSKRESVHDIPWLLLGLAAAVLVAYFTHPYTVHGCMEGQPPWAMYILPLASLAAALWLCRPKSLAIGLAAGFACAFIVMIISWTHVVHRGDWTGNPDPSDRLYDVPLDAWREAMEGTTAATDESAYPTGWLDESPILGKYAQEAKVLTLGRNASRALPHAEIHTVLSGLYGMRPTRIGYWYPGGRLRDALPRVAVLPRD